MHIRENWRSLNRSRLHVVACQHPRCVAIGDKPARIATVKEERRTRGHGVTLAMKQCRLDIRKFSFSQRTVNEWNRLSADCVGASSVNIFKNKIDIYLRRAGYT